MNICESSCIHWRFERVSNAFTGTPVKYSTVKYSTVLWDSMTTVQFSDSQIKRKIVKAKLFDFFVEQLLFIMIACGTDLHIGPRVGQSVKSENWSKHWLQNGRRHWAHCWARALCLVALFLRKEKKI